MPNDAAMPAVISDRLSPASQPPGALDMDGKIAVAEPEPRLAAESPSAAMNFQVSSARPQPVCRLSTPASV